MDSVVSVHQGFEPTSNLVACWSLPAHNYVAIIPREWQQYYWGRDIALSHRKLWINSANWNSRQHLKFSSRLGVLTPSCLPTEFLPRACRLFDLQAVSDLDSSNALKIYLEFPAQFLIQAPSPKSLIQYFSILAGWRCVQLPEFPNQHLPIAKVHAFSSSQKLL